MVIRALVVYSNIENRLQLLNYLAQESDLNVVGDCVYGDGALDKIEMLRPDVVFVGAGPPGLPSLAALTSVSFTKRPYIVVISDSERYAMEAFAIDAIDYLLVPIAHARLKETMYRLQRNIEMDQHVERRVDMDTLVKRLREYTGKESSEHAEDKVSINFGGRFRFLCMKGIRYVEAAADYSDIHMVTGEVLRSTSRISEIANKLPTKRFLRVRRSTIVNIQYVLEARARKDNYEIVMDNGVTFRPGTTYKFKIRAQLMKGVVSVNGISAH